MATSGSANYNVTRDDIITEALEIVQAYGAGETIETADTTSIARTLNMMLKQWGTNTQLAERRGTAFVFLEAGKDEYSLGPAAGNDAAAESYVTTHTNGALAAAATSVTVDSTTGMAANDKIGFTLSDNTIEWKTISAVGSSTTLTLSSGLSNAVADDARVYTYTTKIYRPLIIFDIRIRRYSTGGTTFSDTYSSKLAYEDYWSLGTKNQTTPPVSGMYDRQRGSGILKIWPGNDSTNNLAVISYLRPIEDFDSSTDDADFEQHWYMTLAQNLAYWIAPKFGVTGAMRQEIKVDADMLLKQALAFDADDESIFIAPRDNY